MKGDDTVTIDMDARTRPTILADVRHLPLRPNLRPEALLATPPCTHFTYAQPFPRPGVGVALEIVGACLEAVNYLRPKRWVLENPCNHLQKILGRPKYGVRYTAADRKDARHHLWTNRKSLNRSKMPKPITEALLE